MWQKLTKRAKFITVYNLLFTKAVTGNMIKVFGCSGEFMLKQQIYFYSSVVRRASIFSIKHINNFKTLFNIERDVYLIPMLQCYSAFDELWKKLEILLLSSC